MVKILSFIHNALWGKLSRLGFHYEHECLWFCFILLDNIHIVSNLYHGRGLHLHCCCYPRKMGNLIPQRGVGRKGWKAHKHLHTNLSSHELLDKAPKFLPLCHCPEYEYHYEFRVENLSWIPSVRKELNSSSLCSEHDESSPVGFEPGVVP